MRISIRLLLVIGFGLAAVALVSTMLLSQWAMQSYRSAIELQNRGQQLVQQLEQVQTSAAALLTDFAFALVQRDGDAVPTLRAMSEAFGEQRAALARSLERERAAAVRDYASAAARALAAFEHAERVFVDTLEPVARMSEDEAYRMPALAIANRDINPATMAIAGAAAQMVAIESQRPFGQRSDRRLASLQNLRLQAVAVTANIRGFIAFRTESFADNVRLAIDQLEREVASLAAQSAALDFEQTVLLDDIVEAVDALKSAVPVLIEVHGSEDAYRDRALLTGTFAPLRAELGEAVAQLRAAIDDDIRLRTARADASAARVQWIAWAGVVVFFVALIVAGGFVIASIQRGLGGTIRALENLETGDADLTQRLSPNALAELDRIASAFNRFQTRLSDTVRETRAAASALTPVAERLERQVETSLARLRAQRGDLETVAAAAQELGASAEEIARNSRLGADAADGAAQKVAAGLEAMGQTNRAMSGLLAQIEGASDTVQALGDSSRHITQVVKVIREIAEQTNLLALNAAIEAARAGEHGRGFAVVADEVRQLATRTQKSTEEIQDMIERLRRDAETAVGRMQQSVQDAETTMECTAEVNGGLRAIEAAVREITERTAENASATQQQSAVVDDIANNLQRASDALQAVLDALGEVGAQADRLGELQAATEAVLGRFRV